MSQPDLLLTYNWGAVEWALANSFSPICRHIHFESGFGPEEADRQLRRRVVFRRLALANSECVVVPSQTLVQIATKIWRIPTDKVLYVPNGVDCDKFVMPSSVENLPGFRRKPTELVIGTVAPLRAEKNLGRLLRAFATIDVTRPIRLVIVGDGPERESLLELRDRHALGDCVSFEGTLPHEAVIE